MLRYIQLYLQQQANRKSYMIYRSATFSMTLKDLSDLAFVFVHEADGTSLRPINKSTVLVQ